MAITTVRARFDGTAFVPLDPVDLVAGDLVDLDVRAGTVGDLPLGSPARLLRTLQTMPDVDAEAFGEFERNLAEADAERKAAAVGEMNQPGIFDDLT